MTIDKNALERASKASGLLEQLESVYTDLHDLIEANIPIAKRQEYFVVLGRLKSIVEILNTDNDGLPALIAGQTLSGIRSSKIDRLKIGSTILKMREHDRKTLKEISEDLTAQGYDISVGTIQRFLKLYDEGTMEFRNRQHRVSVFDTPDQLENLNTLVWQALSRFADSPDQYHKYLDQAQRLVKQASDYLERSSSVDKYEQLRNLVIEVLKDELPEKQQAIIARINHLGQNPFTQTLPSKAKS